MKSIKLLVIIGILFGSRMTYAQVAALNGFCDKGATAAVTSGLQSTNTLQGVVPGGPAGCLVQVYLTGTTTPATIYANSSLGVLSNPFRATQSGQWTFYAAIGQGYDVVMSGGQAPNAYSSPVTLTDLIVGSTTGQGVVVEVNGTPISPASPANFVDTSSVTWSFTGDQIQANAASSGGTITILPPPVVVPVGQAVAWAYPTNCVATYGSSTSNYSICGTSSGYLNKQATAPLGDCCSQLVWNGFTMPTLPNDAVIQNIYGVVLAENRGTDAYLFGGCGVPTTEQSLNIPGNFPFFAETYTGSLGNTTGAVTGADCYWRLDQTLGPAGLNLETVIPQVAIAIYYTTASPPLLANFTTVSDPRFLYGNAGAWTADQTYTVASYPNSLITLTNTTAASSGIMPIQTSRCSNISGTASCTSFFGQGGSTGNQITQGFFYAGSNNSNNQLWFAFYNNPIIFDLFNSGDVTIGNNTDPGTLLGVGSSNQFKITSAGNVSTSGTVTLSALTDGCLYTSSHVISSTGSACGSGGSGSPGGVNGDFQFNSSGTFGGTNGVFDYNPSNENIAYNPRFGSSPGYNLGGSSGSTVWQGISLNNAIKYSQGNLSYIAGNQLQCFGNGDCNGIDWYIHHNGECNDANCESLTSQRNYWWLADAAYVGVISGSSAGNTTLTMSSFTNDNFGNGRIAIIQESAQALTITGISYPSLNGIAYAVITVTGATFTPSVTGVLSSGISISPNSSNPLVAESLSLTSVSGSGCAVNDMLTFLPYTSNAPGTGQIESVRVTSAGSVSGGAQTVGVNMRYGQAANSLIWCHGPQDKFLDYPTADVNNVKMLSQVLGAAASNQLVVARQTGGSFDAGGVPSSGSVNIYSGARVINSLDASNQYSGNGFTTLSDNDWFTSGTIGDHIEVADGNNQQIWGWKGAGFSSNPYATGAWMTIGCAGDGVHATNAACGDLMPGIGAIRGISWVNQNPYTAYTNNGGTWNLMPMNFISGPFGTFAYFLTEPAGPVVEIQNSGTDTLFQIDDATAYIQWNKSTHTMNITANNIALNGAVTCGSGCGGGGGGTVTSVGWTGGIVSIATPTTTPAFTIAGTSGGVPYFSSASTWASSGVLAAGDFVLGGGAGNPPTATFSIVPAANGGTGIANTATLTLGTSNQNWATLGTGIVKNTTTTGALSNAASSDVIGLWTGSCSSATFLRGDGACAAGGGGDTITSPNSTLAVGGTSSATTLDVVGAAGKILAGATPALTFTPTLGVSGTAGTLSMFPATGNFTTTWGSAATASNTILGFATAPTTGDLVSCTTASTTCTLTDAGFLASAVVRETTSDTTTTHVLHATATGAIGTFSAIATGDLPTIPIAGGGTNAISAPGTGAIPNSSSATASTWTRTPTLGASGTVGTLAFGNATSGTVTLGTVTGALGAVTASLPANTGTIAELNLAQTWSAAQSFGGGDLFQGGVNNQVGTSYAFVTGDENKLVTFSNAAATAVTLSQATTAGFTSGAVFTVFNIGAGTVTITPATSTINGASTLVLAQNQGAFIESNGTNYSAWVSQAGGGSPAFSAITTGTNTTTLTMGTGGTLTYSGTAVINATAVETAVSTTNSAFSILSAASTTGNQEPVTISGFTINPSTGATAIPGVLTIAGSTHGLIIAAGTAASGVAGSVVYASDATNGYAEVNENNTGLSRVCTAGNSVCASSGISNTTFTNATTAIGGNACSASPVNVTMTGLATSSVIIITPSTDVSGSTGWGSTGGLVIDAWPSATNTMSYKICNQTSGSITPAAVTWNVGAR